MHALLAISLALSPAPARTDASTEVAAREHRTEPAAGEDAATLFRLGRYREAADAFAHEYEANPDPALLYGRAAALKRSGDCLSALRAFEAFIAAGPPEPDVEEARRQIGECEAIVEATAKAARERPPAQAPAATSTAPTPADRPTGRTRWHKDPIAGTLVGTGAPILAAGIGMYGGALGLAARPQPDTQSEHESRRRTVRSLAGTSIPMMAVGAALLVGGLVRWVVLARRQKRGEGASRPGMAGMALLRF